MSKVGIGAGLGVFWIGVGMKAGMLGHGGETDPEDVAFIPIAGGLAFALISTLMLLHAHDDEPSSSSDAATSGADARSSQPDRRSVQQIATQATAAARAGDCRTALRLAEKVRPVDADRHAALVRDTAIARCIAALPDQPAR